MSRWTDGLITLPSGKKALVIDVNSPEEMTVEFFAKKDLSKTDRYVCIVCSITKGRCYEEMFPTFLMAIKQELIKKEVIAELKQDLEFQISVLNQL
jgi:hypothetical protein